MKQFVILLMFLLFIPYAGPYCVAGAETTDLYAAVDLEEVYFYSQPNETSGLFIIPRTYYVKVVKLADPFCSVEYLEDAPPYRKVSGYCKKSELYFVDFTPARPYLKKEITVEYVLPDQPSPPVDSGLSTLKATYLFYGTYRIGSSLYWYVYGNGEFGYLPATEELTYELNDDYIAKTDPEPTQNPSDTPSASLSGVHIFLICAVCVLAAVAAFFLLRGKPAPKEEIEL